RGEALQRVRGGPRRPRRAGRFDAMRGRGRCRSRRVVVASASSTLGNSALVVGLAAAAFGASSTGYGIRTRDRNVLRSTGRYAALIVAAAVAAVVVMERALITRDFSLRYVQQVGSHTTPVLYNVTALWSALEGSVLLWVLVLAGYTA